jgi:predicted acetyltransferase
MMKAGHLDLTAAVAGDETVLSNLLELYSHELSDLFDLDVGANGRFGYEKLPLYFSDHSHHIPFLIRLGSQLAGFALVTRGSAASDDPHALDVAEFFVLRRYRRAGVGRSAAFVLFDQFAGHWTVRVLQQNAAALSFWRKVIDEYTRGTASERDHAGHSRAWRVFSFKSAS